MKTLIMCLILFGFLFLGCRDADTVVLKDFSYESKGSQDDSVNGGSETANLVEIIDPCGKSEHKYDEVVLKVNGVLVGMESSRVGSYLTVLEPGVYTTSDRQKCQFEITNDFEILWR